MILLDEDRKEPLVVQNQRSSPTNTGANHIFSYLNKSGDFFCMS
jgi:hypothetical protein